MLRRALLLLTTAFLVSCGPPSTWYGLSPDHRTAISVFKSDGRPCVQIESEDRECFDGVALRQIIFSPDSRRIAYPIQEGDDWFVVLDGTRGPAANAIGEMTFSPDGRRLAYAAEKNGAWHVVVDGQLGESFDSLFAGTLAFDPTGHRYAFVALQDGRAVPVVNDIRGPAHEAVAQIGFSSDGRRFGYLARDADGVRLSVDEVFGDEHDTITEFRFSPSGRQVAYIARDAGLWWVVSGDARLGPYLGARDLAFRPADDRIAFVALHEQGESVVLGGDVGPAFPSVDPPSSEGPPRRGATWGTTAPGRQS